MTIRSEAVAFSNVFGRKPGKTTHQRLMICPGKSGMCYRVDMHDKGFSFKEHGTANIDSVMRVRKYFSDNGWVDTIERESDGPIHGKNETPWGDLIITARKEKVEARVWVPNFDEIYLPDFDDDDDVFFMHAYFDGIADA